MSLKQYTYTQLAKKHKKCENCGMVRGPRTKRFCSRKCTGEAVGGWNKGRTVEPKRTLTKKQWEKANKQFEEWKAKTPPFPVY